MHFWKLLATIAIRYHLLKNDAEQKAEMDDPDQLSVLPSMIRTRTNHTFTLKPPLPKIWLGSPHDLDKLLRGNVTGSLNTSGLSVLEHQISPTLTDQAVLTSNNGSQVVNTTESTVGRTVQNRSSTVNGMRAQNASKDETVEESRTYPSIRLSDVLPGDIHYFRLNDTWYKNQQDSLPKLTWLALTAGMFTTVAYPTCARWNCPCSGYPRRGPRSARSVDFQLLRRTTTTAQHQTLQLLKKLENNRFRGNRDHIFSLKRCSELRHDECIMMYVEKNCSLEGLPSMSRIYQHAQTVQIDAFLQEARMILASIAMFMDKVRREEAQHYTGNTKSIEMELQLLEELGIYHLLCAMDKELRGSEFSELPAELLCDAKLTRAKADNRNYIVLHTFQKYLESLLSKLDQALD